MAIGDTLPNPETVPLQELGLTELQKTALTTVSLLCDEAVPKHINESSNAVEFDLRDWLRRRGKYKLVDIYRPAISVPSFYLDFERVSTILQLESIDDFPVLSPSDLEYTHPTHGTKMHHGKWQTAFLRLHTNNRLAGHRQLDLAVQPRNQSGWAYSSSGSIRVTTSAWDSRGAYRPNMSREGGELMAVLTAYGRELDEQDTLH